VTTRRLAFAGLVAPPLFAVVVLVVTALEWDFLHDLGWSARPLDNPDAPWPSVLALGDYGFLVSASFLLLGLCAFALAVALFRLLEGRPKIGPGLLALFAFGSALAVIRTDYRTAYGGGPDTSNGTVHAVAFSIFVPAAVASMLVLGWQFRRDERWRSLSGRTLVAGAVALASIAAFLAFKCNVFFWIYLAVVLAWLTLVAARARSL
jgi:hypothetical protein